MRKNSGFTIVEVALVLAIGGAVLALAFIALPNLARSQRDATRKDDLSIFTTTLRKFMSNNNRGSLPTGTGLIGPNCTNTTDAKSWCSFYKDYIQKPFEDPDGTAYSIGVEACTKSGSKCTNALPSDDYVIQVVTGASCGNDENKTPVPESNKRKAAIRYKMEVGGVYCMNL